MLKAFLYLNIIFIFSPIFFLLDGVFTFDLNKINLLFDKYSFRTSSIVAVNLLVIE